MKFHNDLEIPNYNPQTKYTTIQYVLLAFHLTIEVCKIRKLVLQSGIFIQNIGYFIYKIYLFTISFLFDSISPKVLDQFSILASYKCSPLQIDYYIEDTFRMRGWVVGGEWDSQKREIQNHPLYDIFKSRFVDGETWTEAGYYAYASDEINEGKNAWGISNPADIFERTQYLDRLWGDINSRYKSKLELLCENKFRSYQNTVDTIHPSMDEIGVDVGRNGELIFNRCGTHRLIMARLAGIEYVYVHIYRIHSEYIRNTNRINI